MPGPLWGTEGSGEPDEPAEPDTHDEPGPTAPESPAPTTFGAGLVPSDPVVGRPDRPEPVPDWLKSDHGADATPPAGRDPVAVAAVACGFAGIIVFGILLAIVTAVLAGTAGQRARESGRTYELPYLAFGLAFVDALIWLVLHYLTKTPIWIG